MKIERSNPRHWLLLAAQALGTLCVILLRPLSRAPRRPVVIFYGHQFGGNLRSLYLAWQAGYKDRFTCFFLCLDPDHAAELRKQGINVLQCNRLSDMLMLCKAAAMVSDHLLHMMRPLVALSDIRFFDVWHGLPFKGFVAEDFRLLHDYDETWVSSSLLKKIYVTRFGFDASRVLTLGYARTDRLFARPSPPSRFRSWAAPDLDRRIVLYAPTWQQDDTGRNLFPFGLEQDSFLTLLGRACDDHNALLVIRTHLNARLECKDRDNVLYCPQHEFPDTEDILLGTDLLICDWSSIAFDFLALGRPTLFLDVKAPFSNGFSLGPEYRFGCIVGDSQSLDTRLREYLADPESYSLKYGKNQRAVTAELYESTTRGRAAAAQLEHLCTALDTARE